MAGTCTVSELKTVAPGTEAAASVCLEMVTCPLDDTATAYVTPAELSEKLGTPLITEPIEPSSGVTGLVILEQSSNRHLYQYAGVLLLVTSASVTTAKFCVVSAARICTSAAGAEWSATAARLSATPVGDTLEISKPLTNRFLGSSVDSDSQRPRTKP